LIRETDPLGNTVRQDWDHSHQLIAVTDALGHTTRLDAADAAAHEQV
jgi:YD repeat-containing protein